MLYYELASTKILRFDLRGVSMNCMSYDDMSNESLVVPARSNDAAMALLLARMAPTVKYAVQRARRTGFSESEDLAQEGMLGLLAAIKTFDPQKGASFSTYAGACVGNRITTAVRKSLRSGEVPEEKLVSLDNINVFVTDDSSNPESIIIGKDEADRLIRILDERLSVFEREVLHLYLSGSNYSEISAALSVSEKAVDNALQRIRKKLKTFK